MQATVDALKSRGHEIIERAVERLENIGDDSIRVHSKDGSARDFNLLAYQPEREFQALHIIGLLGLKVKSLPREPTWSSSSRSSGSRWA